MGEAQEGASAVYDVFINHRGPDTKKTVASLIHRRLTNYGLRVFLDQDELEAGDPLYGKIKSAISSSSVHVAIFSVRYAESSWCLNELLNMLQSGCKIIPIFYHIKPAELRYIENGRYAEAFHTHQKKGRHDMKLVERWKDALEKASNISGMEFNTEDEHDLGHLVEEIVDNVLKEAKWESLYVAEHPVGLHQAEEDFNNFLKDGQLSGTTVVGIMGLDGSGKSTLVKHLYNCYLQSRKFKRYCFLSELNKKKLAVLQQKLLRDLLGHDKYSISDTTKGKRMIQTCLKGCGPVLIVLDGLDEEEQIESLLLVVKNDVLGEGSLILVTCHDKDLLKCQVNLFYHVKLLRGKDAHDLFCWYAFDSPKPPKDLENLVEKFLHICCGFPLALKVLGRKLSKQDRRYWEEQLKDLSRPEFPINIVDKILKVSYDYLEEKKKEVFLDVAHFLVGEETDLAVRVLEGLHGSGLICLKELESKCLLDLEEIEHCKRPFAKGPGIQWRTKGSTKIGMHDLVRKMARQIASEDSRSSPKTKPLRLCQSVNESILQQLDIKSILQQEQSSAYHVRGIRCEYRDELERQDRRPPVFEKPRPWPLPEIHELERQMQEPEPEMHQFEQQMHELERQEQWPQLPRWAWPWSLPEMHKPKLIYGLRLMVLQDSRDRFRSTPLSGDLIWLRMHNSNWGNTIPSTLSLGNLRVLELDGVNFKALDRMDDDKSPPMLGELTVDYSGESAEIPKRNLLSSSRVDKNSMEASSSASGRVWNLSSFGQLKDLVKMVLKNFKGFTLLPFDFHALRNLRHLDLSGWSELQEMPDSFTGLLQLQYLALQDCKRLSILDLGGITKLEYLDFEGCYNLEGLPDKTTAQRELRYLNLMGTFLWILPKDLGKLKKLEQLLITSSTLRTLPRSFHELGQLRILTLSGLSDISSNISFKHFPYLESLQLWDVHVMTVPRGIPWSSVKVLHVKAPFVKEFSFERDQGKMPLERSHSQGSTDDGTKSFGASDHNRVSPLTELRLVETGISRLRIAPEESPFPDLEIVDLSGNEKLREVESLPCNLRILCLKNCQSLTTLPCLCNLACIRILDISGCHDLKALNLEGLGSIEEIAAANCWKLQSIKGLAQLGMLSHLNVSTFNEVPNPIWSDILGFPSSVSSVILGGANVLCVNAEEMDSVKQSILKEFPGTTIDDIPTENILSPVQLRDMELYGAFLLFFIAKKYFMDFEVHFGGHSYDINSPHGNGAKVHKVHEKTPRAYTFMWSQNSKDLTFDNRGTGCYIYGQSLKGSFTEAWIVKIRNSTDGVKICKRLFNCLCCIPKQAVHQAVAS